MIRQRQGELRTRGYEARRLPTLTFLAAVLLTWATAASGDDTLWTRSLGVEEGLSQNYPLAIAQDRDGFLWIGTVSGLNRWDGHQFESFASVADWPASLSAPVVLALHADVAGHLWVGTPEGLDWFDASAKAFQRHGAALRNLNGGRPVAVEVIASDRAGRVWFASYSGARIYRLDPPTGEVHAFAVPGAARSTPSRSRARDTCG